MVRYPCARNRSASSSTTSSSPATTTDAGPLTAATDTRSSCPASTCRTASSVAPTESIAPPAGRACISLPRAATSRHASSSENTPATCAAAISPTECPAR